MVIKQIKPEAKPKFDRLIEVAGEIFATRGLSATVREICKQADCSVAAVNYYFGDKRRLYFRCVQAACEEKERLFPLPTYAAGTSPAERLQQFVEVMTKRILTARHLSWQNTLVMRETLSPTPGVEEMLRTHFRPGFQLLTQVISEVLGEVDSLELREQFAWQVVARCMFLGTGRHLRSMLSDVSLNENTEAAYATEICQSVLAEMKLLVKKRR